MNQDPTLLIFNRYRVPSDAIPPPEGTVQPDSLIDYYSDEPIVQLQQVGKDTAKTAFQQINDSDSKTAIPQQEIPAELADAVKESLFGPSPNWAYRGYKVYTLPPNDSSVTVSTRKQLSAQLYGGNVEDQANTLLMNDRPSQPLDGMTRCKRIQDARPILKLPNQTTSAPTPTGAAKVDLILFNVLVALEWDVDEEDLRQLEWAFRRASDFLYDITDGRMAFGQVVFGGSALMQCADIQIMASNRLLARSWVGGIREPKKFMPNRLGRGVWHNVNLVTIPWDEPEGYRMLIHEWGHYALYLRDAYLEPLGLISAQDAGIANLSDLALVRTEAGEVASYTVAMPKINRISESIMATLEGTSELAARANRKSGDNYEWRTILAKYPELGPHIQSLEGPGRLPLPLPLFQCQQGIGAGKPRFFEPEKYLLQLDPASAASGQLPPDLRLDHCWIYLVNEIDSAKPRLIAQGTLDARSLYKPFQLLGAVGGDTLVLIARRGQQPVVWRGEIAVTGDSPKVEIENWRTATPGAFPVIEVLPEPAQTDERVAQVSVRVNSAGGPPPDKLWIFPLGLADKAIPQEPNQPLWMSPAQDVTTLDGHVLVRWGDKLMITSFSQGGNPGSGSPHAPPPISPGSSDGTVLLFFYDDDMVEENGDVQRVSEAVASYYSRIKMITTFSHSIPGVLQPEVRPLSYAFSITSNAPLPLNLHATLIMYYDSRDERDSLAGDTLICRLDNGVWTPLPTYLPPSRSFAVAPLDDGTAGSLSPYRDGLRAEFYMVCWIPRKG
jgi:hypothetical protein